LEANHPLRPSVGRELCHSPPAAAIQPGASHFITAGEKSCGETKWKDRAFFHIHSEHVLSAAAPFLHLLLLPGLLR